MATRGRVFKSPDEGGSATAIDKAVELFEKHVWAHSPAKPATLQRYHQVLDHLERILGKKKCIEAITRSDIDDYKIARSHETVGDTRRPVSASAINFEITVLRTFFYYFIRERGSAMKNPCARFKPLRAEGERLKRRPKTYSPADLDRIFAACDGTERAMFCDALSYWAPEGRTRPPDVE